MTRYENYAAVSNQAGVQHIYGNFIFSDIESADKRPRHDDNNVDPAKRLDDEILASLAFPQMVDRRANVESAHTQTCQWLFDRPEYQAWSTEPRGLLWIKGKPGSGKSTLMSHLHRILWLERRVADDINLEFFFSARGVVLQRTFIGMLRSLLNQIFYQDTNARQLLRNSYLEKCLSFGSGHTAWEWQLPELKRMFIDVVLSSAKQRQVTLLIDALDEAGEEAARDIASYFHEINDRVEEWADTAKICISCRHYPITSGIEAREVHVENFNHNDIALYIRDHVKIKRITVDESRQDLDGIIQALISMAGGIFQWARLVTPMVMKWLSEGDTTDEIQLSLSEVPKGLEAVYEHILVNVIDSRFTRHTQRTLQLFQWVCLAQRPLSVVELQYALAAESTALNRLPAKHHKALEIEYSTSMISRRIMTWSGGLLEIAPSSDAGKFQRWKKHVPASHSASFETTVQVIHQSVTDFMVVQGLALLVALKGSSLSTDLASLQLLSSTTAVQISHSTLYLSCLNYLCNERPDLNQLRKLAWSGNKLTVKLPFLAYSACYGLVHAEKSGDLRVSDFEDEIRLLCQSADSLLFAFNALVRVLFDDECVNETGTTILHLASIANMTTLARYRIESGDDSDSKNIAGWTPMHIASAQGHTAMVVLLYGSGADINCETVHGETPLLLAASRGHVKTFTFLLNSGANLNAINAESGTVLCAGAYQGSITICKLCIEAGADVNTQGGIYGNALQAAAAIYGGNEEIVRLLLEVGADVNARGGKYDTALQAAAASYNGKERSLHLRNDQTIDVVRSLIEAGADVNAQGGPHGTALQAAALCGSEMVVRLLVDTGADVNAQGGTYGTALQAAIVGFRGNEEKIARFLLEVGCDVDARGGVYGSALHAAAWAGSESMTRLLLEYGATVDIQDGQHGTALQMAVASLRASQSVVRLLLKAGTDINAGGGQFGNALQAAAAAWGGSESMVRLLLEGNAHVNAEGGEFANALQAAAAVYGGNAEVVRLLLEAGSIVNIQGGKYGSALQAAAATYGGTESVSHLLAAGADVNAEGGQFGSALQAAAYEGNVEVVRALLKANADVNAQGGQYGNALQAAAWMGNEAVVRILLGGGANINAPGGPYGNALQAATWAESENVIRLLVEAGFDSKTLEGSTWRPKKDNQAS